MPDLLLALASLATTGITVALLAVMSRRVLGVPVGWWRCILVAVIVLAAGTALLNAVGQNDIVSPPTTTREAWLLAGRFSLGIAWTFTVGLLLLVIGELLVPSGSLPPASRLVTGWPARWRRFGRYLQLLWISSRHGLGRFLRGTGGHRRAADRTRTARSLKRAFEDAGVTSVKLGQMLATRADLLPEEFITELSTLHADVAPEPWDAISPVIRDSLGRPPGEVFASIDQTPLAAASVGQVHLARLVTGAEVVIKVQRPGAREQIATDLDILERFTSRLMRAATWARSIDLANLTAGFAASLREELDYRVELDNTAAVAKALPANSTMRVPGTHPDLSSDRLLVMNRVDGVPLTRARGELASLPAEQRTELAQSVLTEVLHQVLVSGVFHADLHPGNLLLNPSGSITLLDFGSVGRLDSGSRAMLGSLLAAVDTGDSLAATDRLVDLLGRPVDLDERALEQDVGALLVRAQYSSDSMGTFNELLRLVLRHRFSIPPQLAAAFRALGALEGTLRLIDSTFDLVAGSRQAATDLVDVTPETIKKELTRQFASSLPQVQRLPRRLGKVLEQLEDGRLSVGVRLWAHPEERTFVAGLVQQVVLTVLSAAASVVGALFVLRSESDVVNLLGYLFLFFGFVLALRVLVAVFFHPRR